MLVNRFNNELLTLLFTVLLLSACAGAEKSKSVIEGGDRLQENDTPTMSQESVNVQYIDSNSFDKYLSSAMKENTARINVEIIKTFDTNNIPDRLDKWFYKVSNSGGEVVAQEIVSDDQPQMRGIVSEVIAVTTSIYGFVKTSRLYGPANNYSAKLLYEKDTGEIQNVVFIRR